MSTVFRCVSTWRAAPGKEYEVKVVSMSSDSKGRVILLCSADIKLKETQVSQSQTEVKPEGE